MADKHLSVAVYDFDSSEYIDVTSRTQSVTIKESIDGSSSIDVSLFDLTETHAFDDVAVTYGDETLFLGTIESQTDTLLGGGTLRRFSSWAGTDRALKLDKRVANRIYGGKTAKEILTDLLTRYPTDVTLGPVTGTLSAIDSIDFAYTTLSDCVSQLADVTGFRWYVDTESTLHFFDGYEGTGATVFSTTTTGGLTRNIRRDSIDFTSEIDDKTANRVWVIGSQSASPNYTEQYWTGDGLNDTFTVAFTPNYPEVTENGVTKTIEVDSGSTSDKDYVYGKASKYLKRVAGPLPSGSTVKFRYRPTIQIIDYFEDTASIAQYGIYEKAIKDKQITEKMAARARGRAELKRRSSEVRTLSFEVLASGHDVRRGLRYRVVIPELDIDAYYLCTAVTTTISAPDNVNITKSVTLEEVVE